MKRTPSLGQLVLTLIVPLFVSFSGALIAESTTSCSAGELDMLDWLTLDSDLRSNQHMTGSHPIYTVVAPDKFYWLKTDEGDTWDINLYTSSVIYMWLTENVVWHTPFNYKKFTNNYNVPMALRCATPGYPGMTLRLSNSSFTTYVSCAPVGTSSLGTIVMQVWGPYTAGQPGLETNRPRIGGQIPDNTAVHTLGYFYNCDGNFANCANKEEFILAQRYGLVRHNNWSHLGGGLYQLNSRTTFNTLAPGAIQPFFPCF